MRRLLTFGQTENSLSVSVTVTTLVGVRLFMTAVK